MEASEFLSGCMDDVKNVKQLYAQRKYRRCSVLCSAALQTATHPLHQTFLYFYQAICFECLGYVSHDYSINKIPLLEQARDAFISANDLLPLPSLTSVSGHYDVPQLSPACVTQDMLNYYKSSPFPNIPETPCEPYTERGRSKSILSPLSAPIGVTIAQLTPSVGNRSASMPLHDRTCSQNRTTAKTATPHRTIVPGHKARLSQSLSSHHRLAEALVPSPLFSRGLSSRKEGQEQSLLLPPPSPPLLVALNKPLPPTPINRPLPSLPFNHNQQFKLKGKRIVVVPTRKTALLTLIQKFEHRSPFDSSPGPDNIIAATPTTERFERIFATFVVKGLDHNHSDDKEHISPAHHRFRHSDGPKPVCGEIIPHRLLGVDTPKTSAQSLPWTPCPNGGPKQRTQSALIDRLDRPNPTVPPDETSNIAHLTAYNTHLSAFRTSLLSHISSINTTIAQTHALQLSREAAKRRTFAAMNTSIPSPTRSKSPTKNRARTTHRDSRPLPAKDTRLRSFWSLQAAEAQERAAKEMKGSSWVAEEKARERRERIERLKADGWRSVRMEAKGWKGVEYYEKLRKSVEVELRR